MTVTSPNDLRPIAPPAGETLQVDRRLVVVEDESRRGVSVLFYHRDGSRLVRLAPGDACVLGREAPADVVVTEPSLSRLHARFTFDGERLVVEDLGSTNGTWIAGQRITRGEVQPGHEVGLGSVVASVLGAAAAPVEGLLSHVRFRAELGSEIVRARWFRRGLSVIVVRAARHAIGHVRHWAPRLQALLRPVDRAALYSTETIEVLLPEATAGQAMELAHAIVATSLGKPPNAVGPVPLFCGVAAFPEAATSAEEVIDVCHRAARAATAAMPVVQAPPQGERTATVDAVSDDEPVVVSAAMRELFDTAERLARGTIPVLLLGETGTGKEVLARRLHELGARRDRPLVCVNCAAIPPQLLESTLFGHERGAFTGAAARRVGVFEAADGGTVFLDEVGELPPDAQAALLRVLETKRVTRVGATSEIVVDVRVVAATHRDLVRLSDAGAFRRDLLYRLNAMTLRIPPLRKRREEIPLFCTRFLAQANAANQAHVRGVDPDAMALLENHSWPGNVRELRNVIERGVVIARSDLISVEDLPDDLRSLPDAEPVVLEGASASLPAVPPGPAAGGGPSIAAAPHVTAPAAAPPPVDFRSRMDHLEAQVIVDALEHSGWNQRAAARALSMPLRTLVHKIRVHAIKRPGARSGSAPPKK